MRNPTIYRKELTVLENSKAKTYIIILLASLVLGIAGAALLFYTMSFHYAPDIQHFKSAPSLNAAILVGAAVIALSIASFFITGKKVQFKRSDSFAFIPTFFSVISACFCGYYGYMSFSHGMIEGKEFIVLLQSVFSLLSALWFLLDAFGVPDRVPAFKLLSFSPALMASFIAARIYFDPTSAMNSSIKSCCLLMCCCFALSYIEVSGIIYEAPGTSRKAAAFFVLSTGIGGAVSISLLATTIMNSSGYNYTVLSAMTFAVLWLMSVVYFGSFAANAKTAVVVTETETAKSELAEEKTEETTEETTVKEDTDTNADEVKAAAPDGAVLEETEETEETAEAEPSPKEKNSPDVFTIFNSGKIDPEDRDEFYFEDDGEDDDILIPHMEFDDEDN